MVFVTKPHFYSLLVSKETNHNCLRMLKTEHVWCHHKEIVSSEMKFENHQVAQSIVVQRSTNYRI